MKMLSRFSLLLCVLLLAVPAFAFAEDAANYKDTQTELQLRIERGEIVGPHMVYSGVDKQGISQIFYRNLETGQEKQITDTPMDKHHTNIAVNSNGQVVMVWNETDEKLSFFDVYSHNLSTGVTKKLNQTAGVYLGLQTDGDYAIFQNSRDQYAPAVLVKLSDGSQTLLDNATSRSGTFLHKGKVVFENLDDHSVQLVDLATGTMTQIYKADGFYPHVMDFNGKYCLMHANNMKNHQYKYMILNVETGQTTDLDDWGPNLTWGGSAIGDHYAAYVTKKDGSGEVIINWVDLTAGRVREMKGPATLYAYFMFDGDQLLMNGMNKKDKLIYRTLNGSEDKLGALLPKPAPITAVPPLVGDKEPSQAVTDSNTTKSIRVFLDGEEITFHQQPVLKDGSTTVEFRPIFEKLGLHVVWDGATQTVIGTKEGLSLKLTLGQTGAVVNGSGIEMPTAPFLNKGYTFVPLRFVGEATGRKVLWDPKLMAVYITIQPPKENTATAP